MSSLISSMASWELFQNFTKLLFTNFLHVDLNTLLLFCQPRPQSSVNLKHGFHVDLLNFDLNNSTL